MYSFTLEKKNAPPTSELHLQNYTWKLFFFLLVWNRVQWHYFCCNAAIHSLDMCWSSKPTTNLESKLFSSLGSMHLPYWHHSPSVSGFWMTAGANPDRKKTSETTKTLQPQAMPLCPFPSWPFAWGPCRSGALWQQPDSGLNWTEQG